LAAPPIAGLDDGGGGFGGDDSSTSGDGLKGDIFGEWVAEEDG